jgi:hypothetical protein
MMNGIPRCSLLRQLAWATTLAIGFGAVWSILAIWIAYAIQDARQGPRETWPPRELFAVKHDGTVLIQNMPWDPYAQNTYRDLKGATQVLNPDRDHLIPAVYMAGQQGTPGEFSWHPAWHQRLMMFINEREPAVNWYFVHNGKLEGAGYFVGYERESNRRVGFIGLFGSRSDPVPIDQWIPVRGTLVGDLWLWSSAPLSIIYSGGSREYRVGPFDVPTRLVYVPSGNQLREVDLAAGTITTAFEAPEAIEAPGIPSIASWSGGRYAKDHPILIRTRQQIYALDRKHNMIRRFAVPTEIDRRSPVSWYELGNGQAVAEFVRAWSAPEPDNVTKRMVYRIASDGTIQDQFELTLQTGSPATNRRDLPMQVAFAVPSLALVSAAIPLSLMTFDPTERYPAAIIARLVEFGPSLLAVFALSLVMAVLVWRRCRSFGLPKRERVAWSVYVLLLGIPAYVGFRLCRSWPIRQSCPSCDARAPRDRPACARCGARFPDPISLGTEIFA